MNPEIQEIIDRLELVPHPEGGYYKETFRSPGTIASGDRNLMTAIYFLLTSTDVSHFHKIVGDEHWFHHSGSPLIVHTLDEHGHTEHLLGSDLSKGQQPQLMVPSGTIFGSSIVDTDAYSLVSCTVAPGFDFRDFKLYTKEELLPLFPEHEAIISRLT
jgi:predicted cupin superfamily sugar epimerase